MIAVRGRGAPDTYTSLLLHYHGADGSTTFRDSSRAPLTISASGNAQIDTAQAYFSPSSLLCDADGDYLSTPGSTPLTFGTGDFTLETWIYPTTISRSNMIMAGEKNRLAYEWRFYVGTDNKLYFAVWWQAGGLSSYSTNSAVITSASVWYHVAVVRSASTLYMFINGNSQALSATSITGNMGTDDYFTIGALSNYTPANCFAGNIDETRVSKGIARWTSNFTPPTRAY